MCCVNTTTAAAANDKECMYVALFLYGDEILCNIGVCGGGCMRSCVRVCVHMHLCRWAMADGYGCHLIKHPELVTDMVSQARRRSGLPVSIKIRVHSDLR